MLFANNSFKAQATAVSTWLTKPCAFLALLVAVATSLVIFCSAYGSPYRYDVGPATIISRTICRSISESRHSPACNQQPNASDSEPNVYRFQNGIIKLKSSKQRQYANRRRLATLNASDLESLYEDVLLELTSECSTNRRVGRTDDGGWNLCLTGPYKPRPPCFSFSFGINNIWEFDDMVAKLFKCHVVAFDPSMSIGSHVRSERVLFLQEGLYTSKGVLNSWSVDSYLGFLKRFKSESYVIDILKIDIEHSEWLALATAVRDGSLKNVKQLLLETHVDKMASVQDYLDYFAVLEALHSLGFRLWHYNWNTFGSFKSRHDESHRTCCHELYYINANFLAANNESTARNPPGVPRVDSRTLLPVSKTDTFNQLESLRRIDLQHQTEAQLEEMYFTIVEQQQIVCPFSRRIGNTGDGGWDVCFASPFDIAQSAPCVAFSFGINNVWNYDDQLAERYNCNVYMFDPSMSESSDHQRKETSWFYRTGLGAENKVDAVSGWKMRTLCHLFEKLGYADKTVDILKIDIEHWEWSSLERAIQEGCLSRVKQLLFETHTSELVHHSTDYARLVRVWFGLFNIGFRAWKWNKNPESILFKTRSGGERACCYEHYMLNTRLIKL